MGPIRLKDTDVGRHLTHIKFLQHTQAGGLQSLLVQIPDRSAWGCAVHAAKVSQVVGCPSWLYAVAIRGRGRELSGCRVSMYWFKKASLGEFLTGHMAITAWDRP